MVDKLRKIFIVFAIVAVAVMGMPVKPAKAVTVASGDLIKASGAAVYYYAEDGKRYVFPNEKTYRTWYPDFSTVKTITDAELASIQIGGNVVYRPGARLGKVTTDPKVYAIGPNGVLHWITSESVATDLYGADWADMVDDIPDAFFTNYSYGSDITTAVHPDGTLIKYAASSDIYVIEEGEKRLVADEAAFNANMFMEDYVYTIADTVTYPTASTDLTTAESTYTDVAQLGGSTTPVVSGDLDVAVSSETPASFTAPRGGVGIEVAKFNFSAGNEDVALNGLTLSREGIGNSADIERVYLYNGSNKLTSGRSLSSTTQTAVFTNLGLTIPANSTVTLTVKVDTSSTAVGGDHRLVVNNANHVDADATIGGSFPVSGNTFEISGSVNVGLADLESTSSLSYTRKVGEANVEVGNFTVVIDNTENAQVESITLYNSGRDILSDFNLYRGSTLVASGVEDGDYIHFNFNTPYDILKGDSAKFTVKATVSGRNGDTATLSVRYKTDVVIKGLTYGYPLGIDNTVGVGAGSYVDQVGSPAESNTTTAEAGQVTASFNGPVATDVAKNTNDVVLMNFALTAGSDAEVEKTTIGINGNINLAPSDIEDLELVCNDVIVTNWSSVSLGANTSTDIWSLPAGGVNCQVRVDITNTAAGNETIYATLSDLTTTAWTFKDYNTGDTLTDIVPSGDIQGNTMSVTQASLAVNVASTPALGNVYVPNTADAEVLGVIMAAGAASDIKVSSIKLTAYLDNDDTTFAAGDMDDTSGAKDVMGAIRLYDENGDQLGTTESLDINATTNDITATFNDLELDVPAGTSIKLYATADITSTAPICAASEAGPDTICGTADDTTNIDYIAFAIPNASDIVAEYGSGTALLPSIGGGINTTPGIYQQVVTTGTISASLDADTPLVNLVATGTNQDVTKLKFSATNEDIVVEKLRILNEMGSTDDAEYQSVTISYTNSDSETESETAYFSGDYADFNDLDVLVPKDDSAIVTVTANYNDANTGATNNIATSLNLDCNTNFRSVTQGSGQVATYLGSPMCMNIDGKDMTVMESYPTVTIDETDRILNPSGNTKIATINITAHSNEDITFLNANTDELHVQLNASGATAPSNVWITDNDTALTLCNGGGLTDVSGGSADFNCDFNVNDLTIAKGTTKTLNVYMDTQTAGLTTAGNGVYASLLDDAVSNIDYSVDGTDDGIGGYEHADIIFRGDLIGGALTKE